MPALFFQLTMTFTSGLSTISYEIRNTEFATEEIPILFLHSALSTRREFDTLSRFYEKRILILPDFPGHGESTTDHGMLTTRDLAESVRSLLEELKIFSVDIIGYSMGGYVGLELARIAPSMVRSIVSHGMKFYWTEEAIIEALDSLDTEKIRARSQNGYDLLSGLHSANGLDRTVTAMRSIIGHFRVEQLSADDLRSIRAPLLLSAGDRDNLVTLPEITKLYQSQDRQKTFLAIHPNSPHPISKLDLTSFTHSVREFWKAVI
ncbi:MAG: alpha/beta hydrolase [Bacteroidota bacterium]|nr:alpha/beta hydrolase [Bacteroidota bacterium]MDP4229993.1 alpha/beta hydrolase [Bacteroidota bacterium]MDP4235220.1 alpha/beta hydrolase [Bacteroidota bacterium]